MLFIEELVREIGFYLGYFLKKANIPRVKFVLFGQGKTGCSLLANLLSPYPKFRYEDEILLLNVFAPKLTVKARSQFSRNDLYGIKIKINQLIKDQRVQDPEKFMHELHQQGWKVIYLKRRNILRRVVEQSVISYNYARYFLKKDTSSIIREEVSSLFMGPNRIKNSKAKNTTSRFDSIKWDSIHIDCNELIEKMKNQEMYIAQEEDVLADLPHMTIIFEDDLFETENHQRTAGKVFAYLGLPFVPVKTISLKESYKPLSKLVQNYEELKQVISRTEYAKFLEE